jgi:hypothetical protein
MHAAPAPGQSRGPVTNRWPSDAASGPAGIKQGPLHGATLSIAASPWLASRQQGGRPTAGRRGHLLPELPSPGGMIDQNTESIENSNTPQKQSR